MVGGGGNPVLVLSMTVRFNGESMFLALPIQSEKTVGAARYFTSSIPLQAFHDAGTTLIIDTLAAVQPPEPNPFSTVTVTVTGNLEPLS